MTSISELDNLNIDIEVAPPDEYIANDMPDLLPEGSYNFQILEWDVSTDRLTEKPDGKAFILTLRVVDGPYEGRTLRNQRVWTAKFLRRGVMVSGLGDFIRAIDRGAHFETVSDAAAVIQKAMDQGTVVRGKAIWEAFDLDWYQDKGGAGMVPKSPEQKALRKEATTRGMKRFDLAPDGSPLPTVTGPSGNKIEGRVVIDRFYSAS